MCIRDRNYSACIRLGIPVGVYYYSCAVTAPQRDAELALLHDAINNGKMVEFLYRKADSREKEKKIVSPWQLAWENGCYYRCV